MYPCSFLYNCIQTQKWYESLIKMIVIRFYLLDNARSFPCLNRNFYKRISLRLTYFCLSGQKCCVGQKYFIIKIHCDRRVLGRVMSSSLLKEARSIYSIFFPGDRHFYYKFTFFTFCNAKGGRKREITFNKSQFQSS